MSHPKESVLIVSRKQNIVYLTLNRPQVLNALSSELLIALKEELDKIKTDDAIRGIFIIGSGNKAFSAGADIEFLNSAISLTGASIGRIGHICE